MLIVSDYEAIIFDIDGVLIDDSAGTFGARKQEIPGFFENEWEACVTGKQDTREALAKYLGGLAEAEAYQQRWFDYESKLNNSMVNWVKSLKNQPVILAAATNQDKYRSDYLQNSLNFKDLFGERFYVSSVIGVRKPFPEFYIYIQKSLNVLPKKILFIDDKLENVEGAATLGWHTHHFKSFDEFKILLA